MQARFISLRVTETWQIVQGDQPSPASPARPTLATHEVAPRAAEPQRRELEPSAARSPFPVN
jgi:hypothetical protein